MGKQIASCSIQQVCCLRKLHLLLLNQHGTRLHLFQIAQTLRPGTDILSGPTRKQVIHGTHYPLSPLALLLGSEHLHLHDLDKAMKTYHLVFRQTLDQGKAQQGFQELIEGKRVCNRLLKRCRPIRRPFSEQLFGNGIGSQKRAHLQQLGSSGINVFDVLKGERPGGGNRVGIVDGLCSTPGKQGAPMRVIEV